MLSVKLVKIGQVLYFGFVNVFFFVISELNHHESPSTKDASCQVWLKLSRWFWRKFLNLAMSFRCFVTMTLIKGEALHLKNLESPLPKNASWQVEIFTMVRRIFFKILLMYFCYFVTISPWKMPFIWTNCNSHHPRMLCAEFGWNWPRGSWEEDENVKS